MIILRYDCFFFFNDTATTEIYTLSLHDALPICDPRGRGRSGVSRLRRHRPPRHHAPRPDDAHGAPPGAGGRDGVRSEEHTSELQSQSNLVCRLLLEKKNDSHYQLYAVEYYSLST